MRHAGARGLETGLLADEDDVDAARQFLVDLEDLPDLAHQGERLSPGSDDFADQGLAGR
jgi:hypothetical protein